MIMNFLLFPVNRSNVTSLCYIDRLKFNNNDLLNTHIYNISFSFVILFDKYDIIVLQKRRRRKTERSQKKEFVSYLPDKKEKRRIDLFMYLYE